MDNTNFQRCTLFVRALSISLAMFVSNLAFAQLEISIKHLKVVNSSQMAWSPGTVRENSSPGGGNIYQIEIKIKKKGEYQFEKMIKDGESLDLEMTSKGVQQAAGNFKRCAKWQIIARSNRRTPFEIEDDQVKFIVAKHSEVVGWIQYKFKNQKYLLPIAKIEKTSMKSAIP